MQPGEFITGYYPLDAMSEQARHEAEISQLIADIDVAFKDASTLSLPPRIDGVEYALAGMTNVRGSMLLAPRMHIADPYDSFEHKGITLESRILRMTGNPITDVRRHEDYRDKSIYFIGLVPSGQKIVQMGNLSYGVVQNEDGEHIFFYLKPKETPTYRGDPCDYDVQKADITTEYVIIEELRKAASRAQRSIES